MSFLSLTSWAASRKVPTIRCMPRLLADDEREYEPKQRQRLDQPDADEHRPSDQTCRLGLPGHRFYRLAHKNADPDPGSDGSQAVHQALADRGTSGRRDHSPEESQKSNH